VSDGFSALGVQDASAWPFSIQVNYSHAKDRRPSVKASSAQTAAQEESGESRSRMKRSISNDASVGLGGNGVAGVTGVGVYASGAWIKESGSSSNSGSVGGNMKSGSIHNLHNYINMQSSSPLSNNSDVHLEQDDDVDVLGDDDDLEEISDELDAAIHNKKTIGKLSSMHLDPSVMLDSSLGEDFLSLFSL